MKGLHQQIYWKYQPMVRFLLPFCFGFLFKYSNSNGLLLTWICWSMLLSLQYLSFGKRIRRNILNYLAVLLVIMSGMSSAPHLNEEPSQQQLEMWGLVEVLPEPDYRNGKFRFDANLKAQFIDNAWIRNYQKLRVYIKTDSSDVIKTGDVLLCKLNLQEAPDANIVGAFSMKTWLAGKNIKYIARLDSSQWIFTSLKSRYLQRHLIDFRKQLVGRLHSAGLNNPELAVTGALILGDRSEIDPELVKDFTSSGIVHILAVSGMHVGLIYGAWLLLTNLVFLRRKFLAFGTLTAIPLIWIYATITGLSPSVLRAVVMYSILAIASLRKTPTFPFNSIAAAAFALLLFDPLIYKQIGFQLSFAAVWGIIAAQRLINSCNSISNWFLKSIAIAGLVTVSAQLATAPLGFYHFGTFPVYFFIANLLAVPLATILTYWGIVTIVLAQVPVIGSFFVLILSKGVFLLNALAHGVRLLPNASVSGFYINIYELTLFLILLLLLSWLVANPCLKYFKSALFMVLCISILFFWKDAYFRQKTYYMAFGRDKELDLIIVHNRTATRVQLGKPTQQSGNEEISVALGKKFRINQCSNFYQLNSSKYEYQSVNRKILARWNLIEPISNPNID